MSGDWTDDVLKRLDAGLAARRIDKELALKRDAAEGQAIRSAWDELVELIRHEATKINKKRAEQGKLDIFKIPSETTVQPDGSLGISIDVVVNGLPRRLLSLSML